MLWKFSCNFEHALDATLWEFSCNFSQALNATLLKFSLAIEHALGAMLWKFSCNFKNAVALRCGERNRLSLSQITCQNKMQATNPNAHTYVNGTDVETHGFAVTQNAFLKQFIWTVLYIILLLPNQCTVDCGIWKKVAC